MLSHGSEGTKNVTFVDVLLMYSTFSYGSEGVSWILYKRSMLNIGMLSHGSESKYAIVSLVL